jgi:hypothetical protein
LKLASRGIFRRSKIVDNPYDKIEVLEGMFPYPCYSPIGGSCEMGKNVGGE